MISNDFIFQDEWAASSADKDLCQMKGKSVEVKIITCECRFSFPNTTYSWELCVSFQQECDNFIRTLHTVEDGKMLVCGTNAFNPLCDYVVSKSHSNNEDLN